MHLENDKTDLTAPKFFSEFRRKHFFISL